MEYFGNRGLKGYMTAIESGRDVVKELQTQNLQTVMKSQNLKKPILDCITR